MAKINEWSEPNVLIIWQKYSMLIQYRCWEYFFL